MTTPSDNPIFSLDAEAVLDPAIQPLPAVVDLSAEPAAVFLTGVTGFVGAYLLHELLKTSSADIYCLVRATDAAHAFERIQRNLQYYHIWETGFTDRVIPVVGDLKSPLLGLSRPEFELLAATVDTIFHCGSKLSYVAPYEYLKPANVGGTQEVLRLATTVRPKPVHFVSSLGILLAYQDLVGGLEDDELDETKCPDVGYFQTKYVSERLVRIARNRGIPVTIHRIGLIVGDSRSGVCNPDDFVARILIGAIRAGYAPDVHNAMDMTPVNYVAAAMVYLSRQPASLGRVFHLLNPRPIHWSDIFDLVHEAGYPVHKLPFHQWVEAIEEKADPATNPLYQLIPFFHIHFARRMLGIAEGHFQALGTAATQHALAGSGLECPVINRELITGFLDRFVQAGHLHPAPVPVA